MKLWDLSIKKPVTVLMGLVCLLTLGAISYQRLKLAFLPTVDFPRMWVFVSYPNQNPELLEREVTRPLEEALATLKGVEKISARTSADDVSVQLDFSWGMELDLIRLELGLKVEEVKPSLPSEIRNISIFSFNTDDIPVVEGRISAPGVDLSENYDLLEKHVKQKLERISGVGKVELGGVLPKEVSIELILDKLNQHQVDVGEIIQRLSRDNVTLSLGKIRDDGLTYNVRGMGKFESLDAFENLVVNDQGLKLKDIADVLYEEPPIGYRRHLDGAKALALEVYKESTANTVETAREVRRVIEEEIAADPVLQGVNLFVWNDQAREITNGLNGLTRAGLYGALFAVLVLFVFLRRLIPTLIVATAIPISIIASFIFLYALGYTLNVLTMMGLMLAVGMLVDNAVVVLESIYNKSVQGLSAKEATREGVREVIVALIAATSTTIIVFFSLVIADDNELAVWLGAIGMTISLTLLASLLVSTTVIPLFASKLLKPPDRDHKPKQPRIIAIYSRLLERSLRWPKLTFLALTALILFSFVPFGMLDQFQGTSYRNNRLYVEYEFHDFFFVSDVEEVANQVETYFETKRDEWGIRSIYSWMTENEGATTLLFEDENMSFDRYKEIRKTVREELPEVGGVTFLFGDDDQDSSQGVRVQLFGTDTATLKGVGRKLEPLLADIEGLYDVRPGVKDGKKELQVSVDRDQANLYGVNPETISEVFGFTLRGMYLPRFRYGDRETEVTLGLRIEDRATIEDISEIRISDGVKLGSVANFEYVDSPGVIERVDRKAYYSVRATYEGDDYAGMQEEIERRLDNFQFPAGVSWSWSDRVLQEQDEMQNMLLNILLALIMVYLVMASLFESLLQPVVILVSTICYSMVGVGWMLLFTRTEFDVMAMIGMMILIGIVVNNGIILMDRYNQIRAEGVSVPRAARRSAKERIRPILMTASTTIIGLLPMALGNSGMAGAYYFPLARTVIGGLASSTVLTLIGLPTILVIGWRMRRSFRRLIIKFKRRGGWVLLDPFKAALHGLTWPFRWVYGRFART